MMRNQKLSKEKFLKSNELKKRQLENKLKRNNSQMLKDRKLIVILCT